MPARRGSQAAKSGPAGWGGFASWLVIARAMRFGSSDDHFFLIPIRIVRISLGCVPGSSPIPSMLRTRALRRLLGGAAVAASLTWATRGHAEPAKCPRSNGAWIDLQFSGAGWSISQQESILHELRIELNRRSLEICTHGEEGSASAPSAVVTLVSDDLDRVSIVPSRLRDEGVFSGRTIRLGSIPEDARALAVAQAVDEALRGVRPAPEPPPPTPAPPAPVAPSTSKRGCEARATGTGRRATAAGAPLTGTARGVAGAEPAMGTHRNSPVPATRWPCRGQRCGLRSRAVAAGDRSVFSWPVRLT